MLLADAFAGKARSSRVQMMEEKQHRRTNQEHPEKKKRSRFDPLITTSNGTKESPKPGLTWGGAATVEKPSLQHRRAELDI